jgi:dTDP-4-dehydrorhamnose reductase
MIKVLVTGANGQLGRCIKAVSSEFPDCDMFFASREELDVEDHRGVRYFFRKNSFDYCINTAAYTNVEKAESESDAAYSLNAEAVKNLSLACNENNTVLIHISTDYVFDGKSSRPYIETDETNPINVYGASKLRGEQYIEEVCAKYFIVRTSWLYSQYGHNFLNTILKYAKERKDLTITTEQTGTPTNANDLAAVALNMVRSGSTAYGLYHFSNEGEATWYDFAKKILEFSSQIETTKLASTDHYTTSAKRPKHSILSKAKISKAFKLCLLDWKDSLKMVVEKC